MLFMKVIYETAPYKECKLIRKKKIKGIFHLFEFIILFVYLINTISINIRINIRTFLIFPANKLVKLRKQKQKL